MKMTDYEARKYKDELESLKEQMTDLLIEMELRHSRDSGREFHQWWETEGNMRRYFDLKGECERIEERLWRAQITASEVPRMLP